MTVTVSITETNISASVTDTTVTASVTSTPVTVTVSQVDSKSHDALTIGTANGLSLSGQVLSMSAEADPVYLASPAAGIDAGDIANWDSKQAALPTNIQAAIDAATAGEVVRIAPGTYSVSQTITLVENVSLDLTGVTITLAADVDVFACKPRAHITGGYINVSGVTFTHAVLNIDGADYYGLTFPTRYTNMQMVGNYQTDAATGTAVYIHGTQSVSANVFVYGLQFDNIGISYFQYGIHLVTVAMSSAYYLTLNGNAFANIVLANCRNPIYLDEDAGTYIDGNTFINIQIQYGTGGVKAVHAEGNFNMLNNIMIWDWAGDTAIDFAANYSILITSIFTTKVNNTGYNNNVQAITA
jgi:hypothetical protein